MLVIFVYRYIFDKVWKKELLFTQLFDNKIKTKQTHFCFILIDYIKIILFDWFSPGLLFKNFFNLNKYIKAEFFVVVLKIYNYK